MRRLFKRFGQSLITGDLDRQGAELQARIAVLNGDTALGSPVIVAEEQIRPGTAEVLPSANLRNNATQNSTTPLRRFFTAKHDAYVIAHV